MHPPLPAPFNQSIVWFEAGYTLIVVFLLFLTYFKTKEIYDLTNHKGIGYFRTTLMFFGIAYLTRFTFYVLELSLRALEIFVPGELMMPGMMTLTGYLSTMALFFMTYSTMWKDIRYKQFIIFSNIVAIIISVTAYISRSPMIVSIVQLPLIVITLFSRQKKAGEDKNKKRSLTKILYFMIALFWLINLFALGGNRFMPQKVRIILQLLSAGIFIFLYYKVSKWI